RVPPHRQALAAGDCLQRRRRRGARRRGRRAARHPVRRRREGRGRRAARVAPRARRRLGVALSRNGSEVAPMRALRGVVTIASMTTKGAGMSDQDVEAAVRDELAFDPRVDAAAVAVQADDGTVTLRGTVGTFFAKRAAQKAAEGVRGVVTVENELDVHVLVGGRRDDAELRGDVLQALMLDAAVPSSIDATVYDGVVTLTGAADHAYQREEAMHAAGNARAGGD